MKRQLHFTNHVQGDIFYKFVNNITNHRITLMSLFHSQYF